MRGYFKSSNKNERLDSWNNSLFHALNYANDRKGKDFREIFKDATLQSREEDIFKLRLISPRKCF